MERAHSEAGFRISKLVHAARNERPLGVDLPAAHTLCGCQEDASQWKYLGEHLGFGETVFRYSSSCCQVELQVAVFPGRRRTVLDNDTTFTEEDWDASTSSFSFVESQMVRMKVYVSTHHRLAACLSAYSPGLPQPPNSNRNVWPPLHSEPWTIAGRRAARS
jgi:hypothetical protein